MHKALALFAAALAFSAPVYPRQDRVICGTHREKWREELHLHRRAERARAARLKYALRQAEAVPAARDVGEIAILSDADGVVSRRNDFNLVSRTLIFTPQTAAATSYRFRVRESTYDDAAAVSGTRVDLTDDDSRATALPFPFPFFGLSYPSVFINSDGNLTFQAGDSASTERSLGRLAAGAPRVAGLFRDLDPSKAAQGVRVVAEANRFVVTWVDVPEFQESGIGRRQTFQMRLYPDGRIEMAYLDVNTSGAVVGIAPGSLQGSTAVVSFSSGSSGEYSAAVAEVFRDTTEVDVVRAAQKFYETHDDAYDYLVIFNTLEISAGESAVAFESTVRNNRTGYGDPPVDVGREFGSAYRLQAIQNMGPLRQYPRDPYGILTARRASRDTPLTVIAHEAGHLFLAFASIRDPDDPEARPMLGYQNAHWAFAFNSEASLLEGNRIQDGGPGATPRFFTTATVEAFSPLDQYLMGFRAPEEVPSTFLVTGVSSFLRIRPPEVGVGFDGLRRDVRVEEVIEAEGRRTPDSTVAQRRFRFAFILITAGGADPTGDELSQLDTYRTEFEKFYRAAASERASADATLKRGLRLSVFPAAGVLEGRSAPASVSLFRPAEADLTVLLRTGTGAASVPPSVTIPAGATTAAFAVSGVRAGVEELAAEPADNRYETAYARIQVRNGGAGVEIVPVAGAEGVTVRVTDVNNLPYPGVTVRATAGPGGTVAPDALVTDAGGQARFEWNPGGPEPPRLSIFADGVAAGYVVGTPARPLVAAGGVVNAASGAPGLAPGGLASLYGADLSGGATAAAGLPWPESLGGVRVLLGGRPAPLLYVSGGQINFLVPPDVPEGMTELTVITAGGTSSPVYVPVSGVSPGIFAVIHAGTVQSAFERPARRGDYLEIYSTGLGPVSTGPSGFQETLLQPAVRIGTAEANVTYSGLAPGFLGLYQVNVQVPPSASSGLHPLTVSIGGAASNEAPVRIE